MSLISFLSGEATQKQVVEQALQREKQLVIERQSLEEERQQKMMRQVELWSIMELSYELEEEYHNVTAHIAELVKHIAAIDEYVARLRSARMECRDKEACEHIKAMLRIADPWAEKQKTGKKDALPAVLPTQSVKTV